MKTGTSQVLPSASASPREGGSHQLLPIDDNLGLTFDPPQKVEVLVSYKIGATAKCINQIVELDEKGASASAPSRYRDLSQKAPRDQTQMDPMWLRRQTSRLALI